MIEGRARGQVIVAASPEARAQGVACAMTLAEARTRVADLAVAPVDRMADAAALERLAHWLTRWTPRVALDGADGALLDVTGCAHLFGGESAMMADISRRLDAMGIAHRLGLAASPGAAWALAHAAPGQITRIDGGPEALTGGLGDLPVAGLRLDADALALLRRFGLTRIGQLAELGRSALERRFPRREAAAAVLLRLDQALGRRPEPIAPLTPPPEYAERLSCPDPLVSPEGLAAGLDRLLPRLCDRLAGDGVGARLLALVAYRADGSLGRIEVRTARPARDPDHLRRLMAERIATLDPGHGIDLLVLAAERAEPMAAASRPLSRDLATAPVDAEALAALADRIGVRLGPGAVTTLAPSASHLPERSEAARAFEGALAPWDDPALSGPDRPRPLRLFERPEPIEVLAEVPDGPPVRVVWRRVARQITRADGPERIAPEWWTADPGTAPPRARDYYRAEDAEGRRYWIYREGLYGDGRGDGPRWFLHGLFA